MTNLSRRFPAEWEKHQTTHDKEEINLAEIDHALKEDVRRNWPFLRDRRIDS